MSPALRSPAWACAPVSCQPAKSRPGWKGSLFDLVGKQVQINVLEGMNAELVLMSPSDHALKATLAGQIDFNGLSDQWRKVGCRPDAMDREILDDNSRLLVAGAIQQRIGIYIDSCVTVICIKPVPKRLVIAILNLRSHNCYPVN